MTPRELHRRFRSDESGQALVEFAIVVPLVIMVFMFSIWFTELVQIKLKVQEAARYAAWEPTAFPLHDYGQGNSANTKLSGQMTLNVMGDTAVRYMNMNSADIMPTNRFFSAGWSQPLVFLIDQPEEPIPGGAMVNMIFGLVGRVAELIYSLLYSNGNYVALSLIASQMLDKSYGGAGGSAFFGSPSWGFNKRGYVKATVATSVTNHWLNRGVGKMILTHDPFLLITESHGVLADSWRLHSGDDVYGNQFRPGVAKSTKYWKAVDRIYFVNKRTRGVAKGWINFFKSMMRAALAFTGSMTMPPNMGDADFIQPAVVSKNYTDTTSGQVDIKQDRGSTKKYDSTPVCENCKGGDILKDYGKALKDRGERFMGCTREMSMGCPSSTMQQDNPFGDYISRE